MRQTLLAALVLLLTLSFASPAAADATLFIGGTMTPANRTVKGVALGVSLLVVGFEFEFADTKQEPLDAAPGLRTGMVNGLLQTPFPIFGVQPYFTTGIGVYQEKLDTRQETALGINSGGGVKVSLLGPIRARLDYRIFKLRGDPLHATTHRVYAGVNVAF